MHRHVEHAAYNDIIVSTVRQLLKLGAAVRVVRVPGARTRWDMACAVYAQYVHTCHP